MGLNHEFVIVDNKSDWKQQSSEFYKNKKIFEYATVQDDYIQYFGDFFKFFTLYNPSRNENVCAITVLL